MYDLYHYILALYLGVLQVTTTNMISTRNVWIAKKKKKKT